MTKLKDKINQVQNFSQNILNPFTVDLTSNNEALICGSKGIIEYSDNMVKINCGKITISFEGEKLGINSLSPEEIKVTGEIIRIDFTNC